MDLLDNILQSNEQSLESDYLGSAEQIAQVVTAGLESENYSDMNQQLSDIAPKQQDRMDYIFDHPGVVSTFMEMVLCSVAALAYFYFFFIGTATMFFSSELASVGVIIGCISFLIAAANIFLITRFVSEVKFKTRFDAYIEFLGFKSMEYIEDIALYSKKKEDAVTKDLNRAIKKKLIPQGHFSRNNLVFMVSDKVYDKYMDKPAVFDRYFQKQLEERHRVKARTKRINEIMETGEQYIQKLNDFRTIVADKTISHKIEHMSNIVSMIFHEIDVEPNQVNSLGIFLNYFLPTTEKLLDTYISITEKKVVVPNLAAAKKEIEDSLNTITRSYEAILEKLYEECEMDISSDISAMELMMKKEGLSTELS